MNRLAALIAFALALPALAGARKPAPAAHGPLMLPKFVSFGRGNVKLPPRSDQTLDQVKRYLAAHPEITMLRVAGYYDIGDAPAVAQQKASARAMAVATRLVGLGVDCKRLIPIGHAKGGDMSEGGAYVTFVNAALRGRPIGGAPIEGGGKRAGDACSGAAASNDGGNGGGASASNEGGGGGSSGGSSDGITKLTDPRISPARKKLLAELDKRIPSMWGQRAAPGKINLFDGTPKMTHGTTCGLLPGVLLQRLGIRGPISQYATEGMRVEGRKLGVWVESDGTAMPKPGDIYVLRYPDKPEQDAVAHVGIVYDITDPNRWITADAGQGSQEAQEAKLVTRNMKKVDGTHPFLSGPSNTPGDSPLLRRIGGWVDLDKLMAKMGKK